MTPRAIWPAGFTPRHSNSVRGPGNGGLRMNISKLMPAGVASLLALMIVGCAEDRSGPGTRSHPARPHDILTPRSQGADERDDAPRRIRATFRPKVFCYSLLVPQESWIAIGGSELSVVKTENLSTLRKLQLSADVRSLAVSPSRKLVAAGCGDGKVHLIDAASWQVRSEFAPYGVDRATGKNSINVVTFGNSDHTLIVASHFLGHALVVWDLDANAGTELIPAGRPVGHVKLSPDRAWLAVDVKQSDKLLVYSVADWSVRAELTKPEFGSNPIAFSGDGARFAATSPTRVYVWEVPVWKGPSKFDITQVEGLGQGEALGQLDAALSMDGTVLVTSGPGVTLVDLRSRKLLVRLPSHGPTAYETAVRFADEERKIVYLSTREAVLVHIADLMQGQE